MLLRKKSAEKTTEELAAQKARRKYRWKIIFGLSLPFILQALDTTVIASAFSYIASDFRKCSNLMWWQYE